MRPFRKVTRYAVARDGTRIAWHTFLGDSDAGEAALRDRPAVLLSNGIGTTENFWRYLVEALREDHRVVLWDYRGHHASDLSQSGAYGFDTQVSDLELVTREAMAGCDGEPPIHIGFSMGVPVLLGLYRRAPLLVRAMVLVAGAPDFPGAGTLLFRLPGVVRGLRAGMEKLTPHVPRLAPWVHRVMASPLLYPAGRISGVLRRNAPREDVELFMRELCRMDPMAYWETLKGLMAVDVSPVLPTVKVPTLIVSPARDVLVAASQVERMRRALPRAEYLRLEDAGHAGLLEAGSEVAGAVHAFVHRAGRARQETS